MARSSVEGSGTAVTLLTSTRLEGYSVATVSGTSPNAEPNC